MQTILRTIGMAGLAATIGVLLGLALIATLTLLQGDEPRWIRDLPWTLLYVLTSCGLAGFLAAVVRAYSGREDSVEVRHLRRKRAIRGLAIVAGSAFLLIGIAVVRVPSFGQAVLGYARWEPLHEGLPLGYWLSMLDSSSPIDRSRAAMAVVRVGRPLDAKLVERIARADLQALRGLGKEAIPALPILIQVASDPQSEDRWKARSTLVQLGPDVLPAMPALIDLLKSNKANEDFIRALGNLGPKAAEAIPYLLKLSPDGFHIHSNDIEIALCRIDATRIQRHIVDVGSKDSKRRLTALIAIYLVGSEARAAAPALSAALRHEDEQTRIKAALALWRVSGAVEEVVPILSRAVVSGSTAQDYIFEEFFRKAGPAAKGAVPILQDRLLDPHKDARRRAAYLLSWIGPEASAVVPVLGKLLTDEHADVRAASIRALARIGPAAREFVPRIAQLIQDNDLSVREEVSVALFLLDKQTSPLVEYLQANDHFLSVDNIDALVRTGPEGARLLGDVIRAPLSGSPRAEWQRGYVIRVLGKFGPTARDEVPILLEAADSGNLGFDFDARNALGAIEPDAYFQFRLRRGVLWSALAGVIIAGLILGGVWLASKPWRRSKSDSPPQGEAGMSS